MGLYRRRLAEQPLKDSLLVQFGRRTLRLPSARLAGLQLLITALDVAAAATVLYLLLPEAPPFGAFVLVYLLALAAGELELAQEWSGWTLDFNSSVFSAERALFFRCLNASLELFLDEERDPEQYLTTFNRMFGDDIVRQAWAHIQSNERFFGMQVADSTLQTFKSHQKLLQAYAKLQKAKQAFHEQR
jgi:hypothetical protein